MLTKQAIRSNLKILVNGKSVTKDELLTISEEWNDNQEIFFRKMLQQGGEFTLKGIDYREIAPDPIRNSLGEITTPSNIDKPEKD